MFARNYRPVIAAALFALPALSQTYPQPAQPQYPPPSQGYPQAYPQQSPPPYYGPPPSFTPDQLDNLVSRIALYPDPLLAQVLTAATYPDEIPQAAAWAMQHRYLTGDALARAIADDRLYWQPSVMALLPFPDLLDMMARDQAWTQQLGSAVLAQRPDVMNAVQGMRQRAMEYGYLRTNPHVRVVQSGPGAIEILPVDSGYYYVPTYNPAVVFARPARGIPVGGVISFGPRVFIGATFSPFGWVGPAIDWHAHTFIINNHPWTRDWHNHVEYIHPYGNGWARPEAPRTEHHESEIHAHGGKHGGEHAAHAEHRGSDHDR
jgi:hypothetical protein